MTEKQQRSFYFPLWRRCALTNGWVMEKGRLSCDLVKLRDDLVAGTDRPEPARSAMLQVLDNAEQLAGKEHRAVTAEDLRHACNLVATAGAKFTSGKLNNSEVDRVATLFNLLYDPEDLDSVIDWTSYQQGGNPGALNRVKWFIQHSAPDAYVRAIAADKFGTRMWEWLEVGQLRDLARTLSERARQWRKPVQEKQQQFVEGPF